MIASPYAALTPGWREEFARRWGAVTLSESDVAASRHRLWATRCCRIKSGLGGRPREMYRSPLVQHFLAFAEASGLAYAIVSDKYGLHFPEERVAYYDLGPWDLSSVARKALGEVVGAQAQERGHKEILFYNTSPLMSRPYLEILSSSGLRVFFTTRLPKLEALE